jgi:hypothetical protein
MHALPAPAAGGSLEELRPLVNVADADWPLLVGWLLGALRPRGPYPVLCLHGEQGSAKSTAAKVLKLLIDPGAKDLRSEPKEERDLVAAASNSWLLAWDNLSRLEPWLSDAICRLATGGALGGRELYTDDEEVIVLAQRPVILTGIEDVVTRGDLLDRALVVQLPRIADDRRQTERAYWDRFESVRPRVLGALLDAAAAAVRNLPNVRLPALPRLADFAEWVVAAEPALGWPRGEFLAAYLRNRADAGRLALEADCVAPVLLALLSERDGFEGTCQNLLETLNSRAGDRPPRGWPATPRSLSGRLRRLAPSLRQAGFEMEFLDRTESARKVRLRPVEAQQEGGRPSYCQDRHTVMSPAHDAADSPDGCPPLVCPPPESDDSGRCPWETGA